MRADSERLIATTLILGIGVGVAAILWLFVDSAAPEPSDAVDVATQSASRSAIPTQAEGSLSRRDPASPDGGSPTSTEVVRRLDVDDAGAVPLGPRLRIVDARAADDPAVPDAEVFWLAWAELAKRRDAVQREDGAAVLTDAEIVVRFGSSGQSDEAGHFELPLVQNRILIAARSEDAFGVRQLGPRRPDAERREVDVRLFQDLRIDARVYDATGEPAAGIPVALFEVDSTRRRRRLMLASDASGRIAIPHLQLHRRRIGIIRQMELAVQLPLAEPVGVQFPSDAPPEDEVRFDLPELGTVLVAVQGPEGEPLGCPGHVDLRILEGPEVSPQGPARRFHVTKPFGVDTVRFPHVGLGLVLVARVTLDDDDFRWAGEGFRGPEGAFGSVTVDVPMPPEIGVLTGRVVRADADDPAAGFPDGRLSMLLTGRGGRIEGEVLRVDETGRFELPFRLRSEPQPPLLLTARSDAGERRHEATLALTELVVGRRTDVGVMVAASAGRLAHGRVVDDAGDPVARARVGLQLQRDVGESAPEFRWVDEAFIAAATDDDGHYELYGTVAPGHRARVRARTRAHVAVASPPFAPGAEVDLTLIRTGDLTGQIEAPSWLRSRSLRFSLRRVGHGEKTTTPWLRNGRGRFRFADLVPADDYEFVATLDGFAQPLVRVAPLRIAPGRSQDVDPRIANLDLRTSVFRYRLHALRADGRAWGGPKLPLVVMEPAPFDAAGAAAAAKGFQWRGSRVEFYSPYPQLEVLALGRNVLPIETVLTHGDHDLRFSQASLTEVEIVGLEPIPIDVRLRVDTVFVGKTGLPESIEVHDARRPGRTRKVQLAQAVSRSGAWLEVDAPVVRFALWREGRYRVQLRLLREKSSVARTIGRIDLSADTSRASRVRLPVSAELLRELLGELDARRAR